MLKSIACVSASRASRVLNPFKSAAIVGALCALICCINFQNIQAAPGDLDTTFGAGKTLTHFFVGSDYGTATAVQSDGKIVVGGYYANGSDWDFALARYNTNGSLDTTFSGDGRATTTLSGNQWANGIAIQPDGKIILVGEESISSINSQFAVARYNTDGSPDTTFDGDGYQTVDAGALNKHDIAYNVALQSDGKIIVVGWSYNASDRQEFSVVRLNANGSPDGTFSGSGRRVIDVGGTNNHDIACSVAIQADGKIVIGGYSSNSAGNYNFSLIRLNSDSSTDGSFGGGAVITDFTGQNDFIYAIALQSDGKIIAAGSSNDGTRANFAAARYNANGTLDTTFDGDGKTTTHFNNRPSEMLDMTIQPDGKIVGTGYSSNGSHRDFALVRYNSDGSPDTSFDGDGKTVTAITAFQNEPSAIALQADGKIIAAGNGNNGGNTANDFAVARYNTNGSLDTTFAPNGKITMVIGDRNEDIADMAIQPDGKIVVAGSTNTVADANRNFAVARYNTDGTLDNTFSDDGKVTTNVRGDDEVYAVAIQADGRIVVAGHSSIGTGADFSIVRYNANGTLDTSFSGDGIDVRNISQATFGIADSNDVIKDVLVQTDGKIVVGGYADNGTTAGADFVIVRYDAAGNLDATFDGDGIFRSNITGASQSDSVNALALQSDGKCIFAGQTLSGTNYNIAVGRVNANGGWDNSFDGDGIALTSGNLVARDLVLQSDGKVIVGGNTNGSNEDLMLARYTTAGSLDGTFGSGGIVTTPVGTTHEAITNVALQADGKIIAAGHSLNTSTGYDFSVERYNTNGSLDTSFGTGGIAKTIFGNGNDIAVGLALQTDGKIVVGGYTNNGTNNDFAMARYLPGVDCTYSISQANANVSAAASTGSITVTPNENYCAWTATSNAAWLTVTGGASGTGAGTVNYSVAANTGGARSGTITVAGQTFTVNQVQSPVDVSLPSNITSLKNGIVILPVVVSNTTGKGIISFDFTVTYDSGFLTALAPAYDAGGTLSSNFNFNVNSGTAGQIHVSGYGTQPLANSGAMLYLRFTANGTAPACSAVGFGAFQFNDGNPAANTSNGQVCIVNGSVSGTVTNPNTETNAPVPNVALTATGNSTLSTTTNASGAYLLEGFGNGTYTVTPTKTGDVNGAILSFDASLISRFAVGFETLNNNQKLAADVSGSSTINSYDAALIAQYLVGIANPGTTGTWKFIPASRAYTDLSANQPDQNYSAILMGDVSGNWTAPSTFAEIDKIANQSPEAAVSVSLPNTYGGATRTINVPISVGDVTGRGFVSFDTEINFDPAILQLDSVTPIEKNGTLSVSLSTTANPNLTGKILLSAYGTDQMQGSGTLINLKFRVVGQAGQISPLTFERFIFNENAAQSTTVNGQVTVLAPTAASVIVGGRVSSASGDGIKNAQVTLTAANGETQTVFTNKLGAYRFRNIAAGATYIITVDAWQYTFSQPIQVRTVNNDTTDVNFVANENGGVLSFLRLD